MKFYGLGILIVLVFASGVITEAQTLSVGVGGAGAAVRYWSEEAFGLQLSGFYISDELSSWEVGVLYRLEDAGPTRNAYVTGKVSGIAFFESSLLGAQLLGGMEWIFWDRLSLTLETGLHIESITSYGSTSDFVFIPGFGISLLFYLF